MLAVLSVILSMVLSDALAELPDVLKPAEFAQALRKGRNFPYAEIQAGRLRAVRLGNRVWRIPKSEVARYLGLTEREQGSLDK
jgi:excisionase family DNA binding protein